MNCLLFRLPLEVLYIVIWSVDNGRDVKSLSLTCSALRNACTQRIYSNIYVAMASSRDDPDSDDEKASYSDKAIHQQKRFGKFTSTYGHFVQSLLVEADVTRCPLHVAGFLDRMPNLRTLTLRGTFGFANSDGKSNEKNIPFRDKLAGFLKRSSLQTPPQDRLWKRLRYRKRLSQYICTLQ